MINISEEKQCCGCKACEVICPRECIKMEKGTLGFYYPKIEINDCVDCGLCEKVCPIQNVDIKDSIEYYAGYAENSDTRLRGSSGGIFGSIAKYVIKNQGVVIGSGFDDKLKLKTFIVDDEEHLELLYKSKYIQTDTNNVYTKIKKCLLENENKFVLYCSTPCNIQALKNYLKKEYKNLILIDFVCHGVGSQQLFDQNIHWWKEKGYSLKKYDFRCKEHEINCSRVFELETDKENIKDIYLNDPYYYYYLDYISFRESCYSCPFATEKRCSDITIGDYHQPESLFPNENRLKGFSSIICNTVKGQNVLENIHIITKTIDKKLIINMNAALNAPTHSKKHSQFIKDYESNNFDILLKKYGFYSKKTKIMRIYYKLPLSIQKIIRKFLIKEE